MTLSRPCRLTLFPALALLVHALAGCSGESPSDGQSPTGDSTTGGQGGAGSGATTTQSATSTGDATTTSASITSTTGSGAGGGGGFVCNPAAEPGSIYEHEAVSFSIDQIDPVSMCSYRGEVMLIVNTAAKCGYTPQYEPLEALEAQSKPQGLHVLGFLSDDFNQAGSTEEIEACTEQYGVTFEQFSLVHVQIGPEQHPLFEWLTTRPGLEGDVSWNFNKWLVGRDGTLVARWTQTTTPDDPAVIAAIEAELAAP
jgi:glutathione peroxidase